MITAQAAAALAKDSAEANAAREQEALEPLLARIEKQIKEAATSSPPAYGIQVTLDAFEMPLEQPLVRELKRLGFQARLSRAANTFHISWNPTPIPRTLNDRPTLPGQVLRENGRG